MKVLFATDVFDLYVKRDPLGLLYLSAVLKKEGHQVRACRAEASALLNAVDKFDPGIVAYSATHPSYRSLQGINQKLKQQRAGRFVSVFGGPQTTFSPEVVNDEGIDAVCIGEGEAAFSEFVNRMDKGVSVDDTPNFRVKTDSGVVENEVRALIEDLDAIPEPDRQLLAEVDPGWGDYPVRSFLQSRGCPYNCSFCHNKSWREIYKGKGSVIRRRSVSGLCEEIAKVKRDNGLQFVLFTADTFILDQQWLEEFAVQYPEKCSLPFFCMVRADLISNQTADLLKTAGAFSVGMGIESADPEIRQKVLNKSLTTESIIKAASILHDRSINLYTFNMLGIPGTELKNDLDTLDLNIKIKSDYPMATFATPYPKTELFEKALDLGLMEDGAQRYDFSYYDQSILAHPDSERLHNLMYLFAFAVRFPIFRNWVVRASKINIKPLYYLIYRVVKGYYSWTRVFPHRLGIGSLLSSAFRYVFSVHR